mgnify:FL=1
MASRGRSFTEAVATDNWSLPPLYFEMIPADCRYWVVGSVRGPTRGKRPKPLPRELSAQAESTDQLSITLDVFTLEVVEQATSLADHHQQAPPAVVVMFVGTEVLGQVIDTITQQGHLDLG